LPNRASEARKTLRKYVASGGAVYTSGWASDYLAAASPNAIDFAGRHAEGCEIAAPVVDKGLRSLMGDTIQLIFDIGFWEQEDSSPPVVVNIVSGRRGRWRYRVVGLGVQIKSFPFVVLIGPASQVTASTVAKPLASVWEGIGTPTVSGDPEVLGR